MKYIISLAFVLSLAVATKAQGITESSKIDSVYMSTDKLPQFPGGVQELYKYLGSNIRYPKSAYEAKVQGRVLVAMVIETDGTVTGVKVKQGASPELDAEALRVIKASPKWIPGVQNGKFVRVAYTLPIIFSLKPQG